MLISFVIPVYNTEAYLKRCLDSLLDQSFTDFEIVLVEDGSTDSSLAIAERYAATYGRVRVFSQPNGGQGSARNRGVDLANGDWIWFVDSDDWLADEALVRIAALLRRNAPDVLVANFMFAWADGTTRPGPPPRPEASGRIISPRTSADIFASISCWTAPPWRLVCRRALLAENAIRFATGLFYEDHPFAIQLMLVAERVYVDPTVSYAYFQRAGSTVNVSDRKAFDFIPIRRQSIGLLCKANADGMFDPILAGYVSPNEFFEAHVAAEFRAPFLKALHDDTSMEELALARRCGRPARFVDAIETNDPRKFQNTTTRSGRALAALRTRGPRYIADRLMASAAHRSKAWLRALAQSARHAMHDQHAGADFGGKRYLKAGSGSIVDQIYIDVRLKPENRSYVIAGRDCIVTGSYVFERGVGTITIGDNSSIGSGSLLICSQEEGISIGSNVMLSWGVTLTDTDAHSLDPEIRKMDAYAWKLGIETGQIGAYKDWGNVTRKPVVIRDKAWVGFGASILKGVTIGMGSVVAAQSVVTKDVAPYTIVGGNPARFIGYVPRGSWTWEDTIQAMQGDPSKRKILRDAFLHGDPVDSFEIYRHGPEFAETKKIVDTVERKSSRILDVGSGIGVTAAAFAVDGFHVDVVEPSESLFTGRKGLETLIETLKKHVPLSIGIHQELLENVELRPGYDVVLCRQVAHHFADPVADLRRIHDLLRPGGKALLLREHVVFNAEDKARFLREHPMQSFYGGENAYTIEEYVGFAEAAGFEVERVISYAESPMNYWPNSLEAVAEHGEKNIAGRPYSFVLKKSEAA
jgi:glycosyltransferase involved in cell wall biosynthesis/acetyltransferase-like isoleucine patch superfamily enzyme/SAM-dependent methyltransferase